MIDRMTYLQLQDIIRREGQKNTAQAETYLEELKETGRYTKDVY